MDLIGYGKETDFPLRRRGASFWTQLNFVNGKVCCTFEEFLLQQTMYYPSPKEIHTE